MSQPPLEFPKKPKGTTAARLTVGRYKKAIVMIKDLDTLKGVEGILQYGTIKSGRVFHPLGETYNWNGYNTPESKTSDDERKPDGGNGEKPVPLKHK